jgi:hypothetical protein
MYPLHEETKAYPNRSLLPSSYLNGYPDTVTVHLEAVGHFESVDVFNLWKTALARSLTAAFSGFAQLYAIVTSLQKLRIRSAHSSRNLCVRWSNAFGCSLSTSNVPITCRSSSLSTGTMISERVLSKATR